MALETIYLIVTGYSLYFFPLVNLSRAFVATTSSFFKEISILLTKNVWYVHGKKKLHGDENELPLCIALDCVQYNFFFVYNKCKICILFKN
jgi:hypothetical protein